MTSVVSENLGWASEQLEYGKAGLNQTRRQLVLFKTNKMIIIKSGGLGIGKDKLFH